MDEIAQEITEVADKIEKSRQTQADLVSLEETLADLGPEGLKKAMATLTDEQLVVLNDFVKKSLQSKAVKQPKPKKDLVAREVPKEEDEDEALVEEKNATIRHQGDNSVKPGQVIKSVASEYTDQDVENFFEENGELMDKLAESESLEKAEGSRGGKVIGHTRSGKPIYATHNNPAHDKFDAKDHADAWAVHSYRGSETHGSRHEMLTDKESKDELGTKTHVHSKTGKESQQTDYEKVRQHGKKLAETADGPKPKKEFDADKELADADRKEKRERDKAYRSVLGDKMQKSDFQPMVERLQERGIDKDVAVQKLAKAFELDAEEVGDVWDVIEKAGEGSRGGKIIGHTKSGKPIYAQSKHESYSKFSSDDHKDAMNAHGKVLDSLKEKHGVDAQGRIKGEGGQKAGMHSVAWNRHDEGSGWQGTKAKSKMQKSIVYNPVNPLATGIRTGRNCTYRVDEIIAKSETEKAERLAKGETFLYSRDEVLNKSANAPKESAVNEILAKGLDVDGVSYEQSLVENKPQGAFNVSSFEDAELCKSLGLTPEQAAEILGESQPAPEGENGLGKLNKGGEGSRGGRIIGHTKSGKPIYATDHETYSAKHKDKGFTAGHQELRDLSSSNMNSAHKTLRQATPDYSKEDHQAAASAHKEEAQRLQNEWNNTADVAHKERYGKERGVFDYKTSGVGDSEYSEAHKAKLRSLIRESQRHSNIASLHEKASSNFNRSIKKSLEDENSLGE